jgi:hypothetical protein
VTYAVPGRADDVSDEVRERWNALIGSEFERHFANHGSRFIKPAPAEVNGDEEKFIHWFADPAVPVTCLGRDRARRLCDLLPNGRPILHDEYAEYAILRRLDELQRLRPKRVQITTELAQYWSLVASVDPDALAAMAEDALGRRPSFAELYSVDDPHALDEGRRGALFAAQCIGRRGVPPAGGLNTRNALFMTHPINGLDDLVFIVMFGARPYAVDGPGPVSQRRAGPDAMFASQGPDAEILACRHADPAAALGAQNAVWEGREVAFADPLGMYIERFDASALSVGGEAIPAEWIRWGRGEHPYRQRLEIGPGDDDPRFLDDITVSVGAAEEPLVGGFQLLALTEIGPAVMIGDPSEVSDDDVEVIPPRPGQIDCASEANCRQSQELAERFERENPQIAVAPGAVPRVP